MKTTVLKSKHLRVAIAAPLVLAACARPSPPPAPGREPASVASTQPTASAPPTSHSAPATAEPTSPAAPAEQGASEATAQPDAGAVSPPPTACPADMVDIQMACIDRYEAPNEAGKQPLLMLNQSEAEAFCIERGKRLCTEDEWVRACKGPSGWLYPYGPKYDEHACNQDKKHIPPSWSKLGRWPAPDASTEVARLNQAEPSGQRPSCGSAEGVFDLTGNVGEWVVRLHPHPEACQNEEQRSHRYVVMGCFWGKCFRPPHLPTCEYVNCAHASGFHSYEFGARCCRDRASE